MAQTHIIKNGEVTDSIMATVAEAQAVFPNAICIDADQHPGGVGWKWNGENLISPELPTTPDELRAALLERATAERWKHEEGGLTLSNGVRVATTRADQNRITSVVGNAALAGVESVDFKAESGWTTLTIEDLRGVAAAIAQHVQACFSAERAHHEAVARLVTLEQMAAYDVTAGWPA